MSVFGSEMCFIYTQYAELLEEWLVKWDDTVWGSENGFPSLNFKI